MFDGASGAPQPPPGNGSGDDKKSGPPSKAFTTPEKPKRKKSIYNSWAPGKDNLKRRRVDESKLAEMNQGHDQIQQAVSAYGDGRRPNDPMSRVLAEMLRRAQRNIDG